MSAEFAEAYGIEQIAFDGSAGVATSILFRADTVGNSGNQLTNVLWELLRAVEAGGERADLLGPYRTVAQALGELILGAYQAAYVLGLFRIDEIIEKIHESQMSALDENGPVVRVDGKVLKAPGYHRPQIGEYAQLP
jgi:hypothetical protein